MTLNISSTINFQASPIHSGVRPPIVITLPGTGIQGSPGVTGAIGPQGIPGVTGPQGLLGFQGSPGLSVTGVQGPIGSQGSPGLNGSNGSQGSPGIQGSQGSPGVTGIGLQGSQGSPGTVGTQGVQGLQGSPGAAGPQGVTGLQGLTGSIGPQGVQGVTGVQGLQGSQGSPGALGPQGSPGVIGLQGSPGVTGASITGVQGPQGSQGSPGVPIGANIIQLGGATGSIAPTFGASGISVQWAREDIKQGNVSHTTIGTASSVISFDNAGIYHCAYDICLTGVSSGVSIQAVAVFNATGVRLNGTAIQASVGMIAANNTSNLAIKAGVANIEQTFIVQVPSGAKMEVFAQIAQPTGYAMLWATGSSFNAHQIA